jgi:prepilin-type processing-associated H-X9-DG protein
MKQLQYIPHAARVGRASPRAVLCFRTVIRHSSRAFTLIELLVVCGILGLLVLTLGSALARSTNSQALRCMNNHRQLCLAWKMYVDENRDVLPFASDNPGGDPQANGFAWMTGTLDNNPNNRSNWDPAQDIYKSPLWPFTGKDASLFKCPSDRYYVVVSGQPKPRVRSVSMNAFLGGFAGTTGGWPYFKNYQLYFNLAEISVPNKIFVFLDHRADNINTGNFLVRMDGYSNNPAQYQMGGDYPGFYHDQSCTFSFADGHIEEERWLDTRITPPPSNNPQAAPMPYNPDIGWLQDHATRPK